MEDWYGVTLRDLHTVHPPSHCMILSYYGGSVRHAVTDLYALFPWRPWRFVRGKGVRWPGSVAGGVLDDVGVSAGIQQYRDWYVLTKPTFLQSVGTSALLKRYGGSMARLLCGVYRAYSWQLTAFLTVPRGYWENLASHRAYIDQMMALCGVTRYVDCYQLRARQLFARHAASLKKHHGGFTTLLCALYPAWRVRPWLFIDTPPFCWTSHGVGRAYLEWLHDTLGHVEWSDWYDVTYRQVVEHGGSGLLSGYHRNSLYHALVTHFPELPWLPHAFLSSPRHVSADRRSLVQYLSAVEAQLGMESPAEWFRVSIQHLRRTGGAHLIARHGGLVAALASVYPDEHWSVDRFQDHAKRSSQHWLYVTLKTLFPSVKVVEEVRLAQVRTDHDVVGKSDEGGTLELDVYLPDCAVAFEYQGAQHYVDTMLYGRHEPYRQRDSLKKAIAKEAGITIIDVPYWWDGKPASLLASFADSHPQLVSQLRPLRSAGATVTAWRMWQRVDTEQWRSEVTSRCLEEE